MEDEVTQPKSAMFLGEIKRKCGHTEAVYMPAGLSKADASKYTKRSQDDVCFACRIDNVISHGYKIQRATRPWLGGIR